MLVAIIAIVSPFIAEVTEAIRTSFDLSEWMTSVSRVSTGRSWGHWIHRCDIE